MITPLNNSRPAEILLVDDSEADIILTTKCFMKAKLLVNLHSVENGALCMSFLRKEGPYATVPTPDLILLDLNMPVMDGREVLSEISMDNDLRHLPVVIMTTSAEERDILMMYKLRCSSYITKPVDFDKLLKVIREITNYWLTVVVLPPDGHTHHYQ
jgi:CheY-like chemotaxis protein